MARTPGKACVVGKDVVPPSLGKADAAPAEQRAEATGARAPGLRFGLVDERHGGGLQYVW